MRRPRPRRRDHNGHDGADGLGSCKRRRANPGVRSTASPCSGANPPGLTTAPARYRTASMCCGASPTRLCVGTLRWVASRSSGAATGWTGQPVVWERPDGVTEVIFGAYDKNIHFVNAATGERTRPDFYMGDIIKGSVVLDPDGYPLLYVGSRDSRYRIIALDRDVPTELWGLDAASVAGIWNNDWDSSAAIVNDMLLEGGENSWWFAVKLNRKRDETGLVTVEPEILYETPMWTDQLLAQVGRQQSVEDSTAVFGDTAYVANSAGRVVGFDISDGDWSKDRMVFDFWMGDDVDASIVIDGDGKLYVASEIDLATSRGAEVGQLVKLDPTGTIRSCGASTSHRLAGSTGESGQHRHWPVTSSTPSPTPVICWQWTRQMGRWCGSDTVGAACLVIAGRRRRHAHGRHRLRSRLRFPGIRHLRHGVNPSSSGSRGSPVAASSQPRPSGTE